MLPCCAMCLFLTHWWQFSCNGSKHLADVTYYIWCWCCNTKCCEFVLISRVRASALWKPFPNIAKRQHPSAIGAGCGNLWWGTPQSNKFKEQWGREENLAMDWIAVKLITNDHLIRNLLNTFSKAKIYKWMVDAGWCVPCFTRVTRVLGVPCLLS